MLTGLGEEADCPTSPKPCVPENIDIAKPISRIATRSGVVGRIDLARTTKPGVVIAPLLTAGAALEAHGAQVASTPAEALAADAFLATLAPREHAASPSSVHITSCALPEGCVIVHVARDIQVEPLHCRHVAAKQEATMLALLPSIWVPTLHHQGFVVGH